MGQCGSVHGRRPTAILAPQPPPAPAPPEPGRQQQQRRQQRVRTRLLRAAARLPLAPLRALPGSLSSSTPPSEAPSSGRRSRCKCRECRGLPAALRPTEGLILAVLPVELLERILAFLDLASLGAAQATCTTLAGLRWPVVEIPTFLVDADAAGLRAVVAKAPRYLRLPRGCCLSTLLAPVVMGCPTLLVLDLRRSGLGPTALEHLARGLLEVHGTLRTLLLSNNPKVGSTKAMATLAHSLDRNTSLRRLGLAELGLSTGALAALAGALARSTTLEKLDLAGNDLGSDGAAALADGLHRNRSLVALNLADNDLRADGARALAPALRQISTLRTLDLGENRIDSGATLALCRELFASAGAGAQPRRGGGDGLRGGPASGLLRLVLDSNRIDHAGLQTLCAALAGRSPPPLQTVSLWDNYVGDRGARAVARALSSPHCPLTALDLSFTGIGGEGAAELARALAGNATLAALCLKHCRIRDYGAIVLANLLRPCGAQRGGAGRASGLRSLNLESCDISPRGTAALADALAENGTLRTLNLKGNAVGDLGAESIASGLRRNRSLTRLDLRGAPSSAKSIGLLGAVCLADTLKVNRTLRVLQLEGNAIGQESSHLFAHSRCQVKLLLSRFGAGCARKGRHGQAGQAAGHPPGLQRVATQV